MKKQNWIWMPHPAHFCAAQWCKFFLNTYVGKYIVSTIGEYHSPAAKEIKEIGLQRKYETMAFSAKKSNEKCCPFTVNNFTEIDMKGYNNAEEAVKGHYQLCNKWSKK